MEFCFITTVYVPVGSTIARLWNNKAEFDYHIFFWKNKIVTLISKRACMLISWMGWDWA